MLELDRYRLQQKLTKSAKIHAKHSFPGPDLEESFFLLFSELWVTIVV